MLRTVTFKIEYDLLELLDMYAAKYRLNRSEAIRLAIEKLIKEDMQKEGSVPIAKVEKIRLG